MSKPTLIKITKLEEHRYPEYEILEDHSGKAYGMDIDEPTNVTEEEACTGVCYRNGVEYLFIEYDWKRHVGTAVDEAEGWHVSVCEELEEIRDQLHIGQIFTVDTNYLWEGRYNNTVKVKENND